jgi:hypothetical protein
MKRSRLPYAV